MGRTIGASRGDAFKPKTRERLTNQDKESARFLPSGKRMPVPRRSCTVSPISRIAGWFEPEKAWREGDD